VRPGVGGALTADTLHVYPTALKAVSELHDKARAAGCLLGHRLTTFPELTDALARDLGAPARVLEPEMAAVVLARALERPGTPAALRAPGRGILHELLAVIGDFEAAYLAPDDVAAVAAALRAGPAARRLADLALVYAAYETALAELGAVDRHGRERCVVEGLAVAEAAGTLPRTLVGVGKIVFAEIYDFSVLQFLLATSLIRLVGDAELVAFAHPENVDATRFLDRTWNRFVGDPDIADRVLPSFVARRGRTGSLAAALRGVFAAEPPEPVRPDGSVRLVVAPGRYGEVEAAVRDVRRRLEHGEPAERLALLARDLAVYGDLIEDVCRRYRVPVYFRKGKPLVANGLVKACLNVLRCVIEGFPRTRLEAVLDTDYLRAPPRGLVRVLREVGFVAETARPLAECIAHRLDRLAVEAADPEHAVRAAREGARLAAAAAPLVALLATLRALDARRTPAGHVGVLRRALRRLGLRSVPAGPDPPPTARRDARAWERLEQTLGLLAGITGTLAVEPMPLADFLRLLLATLEPLEVEDPAERAGVRALSVRDARGLDFDAVYLLGLDDGTFPAPRAESALWPDAMKREANRPAAEVLRRKLGSRAEGLPLGGLFRTAREAGLEDPFLFFLALSMAEREIVLSQPAVDDQGNPTVPSPFLDEIRRCTLGDLPTTRLDTTAVVPAAGDCCELTELVGRASLERWSRRAGAGPDRLSAALADAGPALAARLASVDRRGTIEERRTRWFLSPGDDAGKEALADRFVGRLPGSDALAARIAAMRWTPGRLDALGRCGFRFFAQEVLGLRREDDPETEVGVRERGTLAHAVLETLFRAHPRLPADRRAARALAREHVAALREHLAGSILAKDRALLDVAWRQVEAAVDVLVEAEHAQQTEDDREGRVVARMLEEPVAWTLPDPNAGPGITLYGRPDRVEIRRRDGVAVGLRVLDYKMSRDRTRYLPLVDPKKELGRTAFQIPVYLLGVRATIPDLAADAQFEGGYLLLLAAPKEGKLLRALAGSGLDEIAGRIAALVGRASGGRFDVDPDPCDPYCAYRAVCRYQRPPLEEETSGA
jgi:hypothetical protein